jgi:hypothetical protein
MLRFSDDVAATVTVSDNGAGDINPATGLILSSVTMTDYTLVVGVSTSKPINSRSPALTLTLTSVSYIHSGVAPMLTVMATDNNFAAPTFTSLDILTNQATQNMGTGVTAASSAANGYINQSNVEFDTSSPTAIATPQITFSAIGSSQSGTSFSGSAVGATPYSLTTVVTIESSASFTGGSFTSRLAVNAIPEPSTLAIWATLGGLGLIVARRRRKAA